MKKRVFAVLFWLGTGGLLQAQPGYPMYPMYPVHARVTPVAHWGPQPYPVFQSPQPWNPPVWAAYTPPALPPALIPARVPPPPVCATPAPPAASSSVGRIADQFPPPSGPPPVAAAEAAISPPPPPEPYVHHMPCEPYLHDVTEPGAGRGPAHYARADYLLLFAKKQVAPPLLVVGTPDPAAAVIGAGPLDFQNDARHGGRLTYGYWLDMKQTWAVEASFLFWSRHTSTFAAGSAGTPLMTVPFTNVVTGTQASLILAQPLTPTPPQFSQSGFTQIEAVDRLWGAEVNLRRELHRGCRVHVDLLAGLRYLNYDEALNLTNSTVFSAAPIIPSDASIIFFDRFGTHNQFVGGQLGLSSEVNYRSFFVNLWGKAAIGSNHQTVDINGSTVARAPPPTLLGNQDLAGGIFTQPSNIGQYQRDVFAVVPEAGINLGYQWNHHLRFFGGYSILFINSVVRPAEHIDTTINPNANIVLTAVLHPVPPAPPTSASSRPAFTFRDSEFWAQGFNLGLEFRY